MSFAEIKESVRELSEKERCKPLGALYLLYIMVGLSCKPSEYFAHRTPIRNFVDVLSQLRPEAEVQIVGVQ